MLKNRYLGVLLLILVCFACDSNRVFDAYKSVPDKWHKDSIISFKVSPPDSIKPYNLFVNLRNTNDYKYSNLFLIVEMDYPNGKVVKDTLEYTMAAPNGELLGEGFTDVKENKLWFKGYNSPFVFNESGEYTVNIQHAMRENGKVKGVEYLDGITDIGFRIEQTASN
ncbi:MAG: gliding motility lipoprotein GldH [Bacteroidetes bacterium MedPE-SWsnd-G2]|nr:MAG: gliding motility lipoprotein GldH [Bacteroidetes bacterium MedPE-SWsnd-G2]